jgi:hypothetical protein
MAQRLLHARVMRTAGDRFAPPPDIDDGWRDIIVSSAPPPPMPVMPPDPTARTSVNVAVTTDRQGCVTRVQFGDASILPRRERPSFEGSDRRMWMVAGGLMGLATLVLLVLGVLTFRSEATPTSQQVVALPAPPPPKPMVATRAVPPPATVMEQTGVGSARPLIAQHALRHSSGKHSRKHKRERDAERSLLTLP